MNIFEVFFWFCKQQKIMDLMLKLYYNGGISKRIYDNGKTIKKLISFSDFISNASLSYGISNVFWAISQNEECRELLKNERYKNAMKKWNAFSKNNIFFCDDYLKIGDEIEITKSWGTRFCGTVINMKPKFSGFGSIIIRDANGRENYEVIISDNSRIIINGTKKEPKFYIKQKRKIYGIDKR